MARLHQALVHAETDWCSTPVVLYGFLDPETVRVMLDRQPAFSYLFRLSNSSPGVFAVDYLQADLSLSRSLIYPTNPGVEFTTEEGRTYMYASLAQLGREHSHLKYRLTHGPVSFVAPS